MELLRLKNSNINIDLVLGNIFKSVFEDKSIDFINIKEKNYEKWDSLRGINLLLEVEKEFGIQIPNDDLLNFNSYQNIKNIIKRRLNG